MAELQYLQEQYREYNARSRALCEMDPDKMSTAEATELRGLTEKLKNLRERILGEEQGKPDYIPSGITQDPNDREPEHRGGPARDRSYRGMFYPGQEIPRSPFKSADEFLQVATSGLHDGRLERASMTEGTGSAGGFSVPPEYASQWLDDSLGAEIVRPLAAVWPMTSSTRIVPAWDDLSRADGTTHGGIALQWLAEEATGTKQTARLRKIQLSAKKAGIYIDASSELIADGLGFETQLQLAMKKSLSYGLDHAFLFGSGAGMPLGALMGDDVVTVAAEVGQAADSVIFENCAKMFASMWDRGKRNAVWLANPGLVPWLLQLSVVVGTGGSIIQVLNEKDGGFSLFGRPVLFSEAMSAPGDLGDFALADFSQYYIGLRAEMALDRSIIPGWTEDLVSFRVLCRLDGQSTWGEQLTPRNGTAQGAFVRLAAR